MFAVWGWRKSSTRKNNQAMKINQNVVVATGGWSSDKLKALPCSPESPKGKHFMQDKNRRKTKNLGEYLIDSECKYCGCRILDCPTIFI